MTEMLKGVCIIILIVCIGVMMYSICHAIRTARQNKATDELSRQIFLAKINQAQNANNKSNVVAKKVLKQPFNFEQEKPKELDYDKIDEDNDIVIPSDKTLKDFFKKQD
jgi:heme/copper-type cytochrome/quinol oxidase subunit 2